MHHWYGLEYCLKKLQVLSGKTRSNVDRLWNLFVTPNNDRIESVRIDEMRFASMIKQINICTQYPGACTWTKSGQNSVSLSIIHTNDLHGYIATQEKPVEDDIVGGMARVAGEIASLKARNPECTIVVDGGDIFDGGFYSKYTGGEVVSRPFAQIGYDAVTLGNHDVSWGPAKVAEIAKDSNTDFLAANMVD